MEDRWKHSGFSRQLVNAVPFRREKDWPKINITITRSKSNNTDAMHSRICSCMHVRAGVCMGPRTRTCITALMSRAWMCKWVHIIIDLPLKPWRFYTVSLKHSSRLNVKVNGNARCFLSSWLALTTEEGLNPDCQRNSSGSESIQLYAQQSMVVGVIGRPILFDYPNSL